jgi:hypothetical protein
MEHGHMDHATEFTVGAEATCTDGPCGEIRSVVVDPVAQRVTHHVIEAKHRSGLGRLVPLDLVEVIGDDVVVHCDLAAFAKLDLAEENQFMPGSVG